MHEETIDLNELGKYCKLTNARCGSFAEAAAICLEKYGHVSGVKLKIIGGYSGMVVLNWDQLEDESYESWLNIEEAVEDAAYGIAILVIWGLTPYHVIRQSLKGSKIDFWCGAKEDSFLFQGIVKLEVSGILKGSVGQMNYRIKQKLQRAIENKDDDAPLVIVIAEFSEPIAKTLIEQ